MLLQTYRMLMSMLSLKEKRMFWMLLFLVLFLSAFEALSVFSVVPFLQVISAPETIHTNPAYKWLYDRGGFETDLDFTIAMGFFVFTVTLSGLLLKALSAWVVTRFTMMRSYGLSLKLLQGYLHQPYAWFLSRHSAELGTSVLSEVDNVVRQSLLPALRLIPDVIMAIILVGILFSFEPMIAIGAVVVLGGSYAVVFFLIKELLYRVGRDRQAANRRRFRILQEATGGVKELKIMGLEDGFLKVFRHAAYRMARAQTRGLVLNLLPRYTLEALAFGGMILTILWLVVREEGNLETLLPTLGLVAMAGTRLFPAIQNIYRKIATLRVNQAVLIKLHADLHALDPAIIRARRASDKQDKLPLADRLELRDLRFSYPNAERAALNGVSLTIKANTTVGLVGGTGAGKTTLVDIVLGLLDPEGGGLYVDGKSVDAQTRRPWQKSLGYVPQHIFLTDDTVAANIAFGTPKELIDPAALERAARAASLHDFVMQELPDGYQTRVGERGVRLSGGQRQRIGIARALYHDPDVLIMDEATSALDNLTERAVMEAVHNIGGSKTIILIAHRLTTVQPCDEIFLLRGGQVAASGTFDQLVAQDAEFRDMAQAV